MNPATLFDAEAIVGDLGLVGILAILFAETGLLVGMAFPGDSLLFVAGIAASGAGERLLGAASLHAPSLFVGAAIAAIAGAQMGYWLGYKYGRKLFDRPDGRIFTHERVVQAEKWLAKYGPGKALVLGRYVPFVRTLLPLICGIVRVDIKKFTFWNIIGGIIWTQTVMALGWLMGNRIEGSVDKYILPIVGAIIVISLFPVVIEALREWRSRRHLS